LVKACDDSSSISSRGRLISARIRYARKANPAGIFAADPMRAIASGGNMSCGRRTRGAPGL
jgi:hypothetical protein